MGGFAAYVSYHVNHPLYTAPSDAQMYAGLAAFMFCELGNFSIHWALRCLRPPGTKIRKIPQPTGNPLTCLFNFVSCPNYTYEIGAWISFTIMTQCLPGMHSLCILQMPTFSHSRLQKLFSQKNLVQKCKN